jgi:hypothetical protein
VILALFACAGSPAVWVAVTAGNGSVCGLTDRGRAYCWGWIAGDDDVVELAPDETGIVGVDLGGFTSYNDEERDLACVWTLDGSAECSDGKRASGFQSVTVGYPWFCGLRLDGRLDCTENPINFESPGPPAIAPPSSDFIALCAVLQDGPRCWGLEHFSEHIPPTAKELAVNANGPCWLDESGEAGCWSAGVADSSPYPGPFEQVVHGALHACALDADGRAWCWGETATSIWDGAADVDDYGQLDAPDERFRALSTQLDTTCGVTIDGRIVCWGRTGAGEPDVPENPDRDVRRSLP